MVCSNCNAILPDDSVFCPECGSKVTIQKPVREKKEKKEKNNGLITYYKTPLLWLVVIATAFMLYHCVFGMYWYNKVSDFVFGVVILIAVIAIVLSWRNIFIWIFTDDVVENVLLRKIITIAVFVGVSALISMVTGGAQYAGYEFVAYPLPIVVLSLIVALIGIVRLKVCKK